MQSDKLTPTLINLTETDNIKSGSLIYTIMPRGLAYSLIANKKLAFGKTYKFTAHDTVDLPFDFPQSRELVEGYEKEYMGVKVRVVVASNEKATLQINHPHCNGMAIVSKKEIYPEIESFNMFLEMILSIHIRGEKN
jgi:hypothetical protein